MNNLQDSLNKIKGNESFLEKMKRIIPGYDGYVNRDNSRELDTLLRNQLALKLEQNRTKIKNTVANFSRNGKLFEASDIDKLDKKNDTVVAKFRSAARGYSGAFDVVKVKEEKLNQLYEFDSLMLSMVEEINSLFEQLESTSSANQATRDIESTISTTLDKILVKFDERESLLKNIQ